MATNEKNPNELVKVAAPKVKGNDSGFKFVHRGDLLPGEVVVGEEKQNDSEARTSFEKHANTFPDDRKTPKEFTKKI